MLAVAPSRYGFASSRIFAGAEHQAVEVLQHSLAAELDSGGRPLFDRRFVNPLQMPNE